MSEEQGKKGSFEERLSSARRRQGLESAADGSKKSGAADNSNLGMGLRVGVELVSAVIVAVAIGWALDSWLHTKPFLLIVFVLLGGGAGIANIWRLVGPKPPKK